jgi:hypothetical protein
METTDVWDASLIIDAAGSPKVRTHPIDTRRLSVITLKRLLQL